MASLPPADYRSVFKETLTLAALRTLVGAAASRADVGDAQGAAAALAAAAALPRFATVALALPKLERAKLSVVFDGLAAVGQDVASTRAAYRA